MLKRTKIVKYLQELSASDKLPSNGKLPSQTALMRQFGVSRTTVVKALEELRIHGQVCGQQGRGVYALPSHAPDKISQIVVIGEHLNPDSDFPFSEMIWGIENAGRRLSFLNASKMDNHAIPVFHRGQAIIWLLPELRMLPHMEHLRQLGIPQLLINRDFDDYDCIITDTMTSLREGLSWLLIEAGRDLAVISYPPVLCKPYRQDRLSAIYELCLSLQANLVSDLVFKCPFLNIVEDIDNIVQSIFHHPQPPRGIFILDHRIVIPFIICASKYGKTLAKDYKLLVMDGRPDYPHSPGLAILKQSFHLFQVEIEEWLRIALKPKRSLFQKRIKCSLQINR